MRTMLTNARRMGAAAVTAVLLVLLAGCSSDGGDDTATPGSTPAAQDGAGQPPLQAAASGLIPDIVDRIEPSVVAVQTTTAQGQGEGSGVIWNDQGIIVTNHHVVEGATEIEVVFTTGERVPAKVRAADPLSDLAVLETGRTGLSPAEFAEDTPRVGALAIAMGSPLGLENSVTAGIVSGKNRTVPGSVQSGIQSLVGLMQTDAPISPGNSGGALVGAGGKVIGINVAYLPPGQGAVSIGFAIPSPTVINVVEQLLEDGTVEHAYIGVSYQVVTEQVAAQFGLPVDHGVLVVNVQQGAPAASVLQRGDIIVQAGDQEVRDGADLVAAVRSHSPGDTLEMTVYRDGSEQTVRVPLTDRPEQQQR